MAPTKKVLAVLMFLGTWVLGAPPATATDHTDGSVTANARKIDLTDLYAFKTGSQQEKLVVVLGIITAAQPWETPDPSASFDIVFGAVDRNALPTFRLLSEPRYRLECRWSKRAATCLAHDGTRIEAELGVTPPAGPLRLFAGPRSDPFVLNGRWARQLAKSDTIPEPFDENVIRGFNVLSLVVEIIISAVMPSLADQVIALGAEARDRESGRILDRIGRPEIANVALQSSTGPDLRNSFNSFPALTLPEPFRGEILARLRDNLNRYDAMDPAPYRSDKDMLAEILADDYLTIDAALTCEGARYFDLETAALEGSVATRCGGRPIEQDIIDSVYGLLIRGSAHNLIADGAATPTRATSADFPFLAEPNTVSTSE